jgi:hypothetical protein
MELFGLIASGIAALIGLNTRLAVARLHNSIAKEQEERCRHCEAVRIPDVVRSIIYPPPPATVALVARRRHAS